MSCIVSTDSGALTFCTDSCFFRGKSLTVLAYQKADHNLGKKIVSTAISANFIQALFNFFQAFSERIKSTHSPYPTQ